MLLVDWTDLPPQMQNNAVKPYYDALKKRTPSLVLKRCFDVLLSAALLVLSQQLPETAVWHNRSHTFPTKAGSPLSIFCLTNAVLPSASIER